MGQAFLQSPGLAATFKTGHTLDGIKPDVGPNLLPTMVMVLVFGCVCLGGGVA